MQDLLETAAKLFLGFLVVAGATRQARRSRRHGRRYPFEYQNHFVHRPGGPRGGAPSFIVGGFMVLLGFLLLMAMIGPQLIVNMGLAVAFCFAPLVVIGIVVAMALRNAATQGDSAASTARRSASTFDAPARLDRSSEATSEAKTDAAPKTSAPPVEPFTRSRMVNPFRIEREKPPHAPSYYRERAAAYRQRIQNLIKSRRKGPLAETFAGILPRLERWEERVTQLAGRLANFEGDKIIQRDIREAPQNISRLEQQIAQEGDAAVRAQMEKTLDGYAEQQDQLEALVRLMRRTRLQLDDTLAAMGTIYSQVQMLDAMDIDGARATHIAEEIEDEVARMNDLLSAFGDANDIGREDVLTEEARRIRLGRDQSAS